MQAIARCVQPVVQRAEFLLDRGRAVIDVDAQLQGGWHPRREPAWAARWRWIAASLMRAGLLHAKGEVQKGDGGYRAERAAIHGKGLAVERGHLGLPFAR